VVLRPGLVIIIEWIAFAASWLLAAGWSSAVEKRLGMRREIGYRTLLIAGGVLLGIPAHGYRGPLRLWLVGWTLAWACVLIIAAGFSFAWWARLHLGELWSGSVTAKESHHVVDSGPYSIVRHPIYTGVLTAVIATAVAKGTVPGLAGLLLIALGVWMKARLEETWLTGQLEAGAYQRYRRQIPMLIPFWRTAG
jgi:protein-S-isoprenylcysteine O-methyltransferase Ste14